MQNVTASFSTFWSSSEINPHILRFPHILRHSCKECDFSRLVRAGQAGQSWSELVRAGQSWSELVRAEALTRNGAFQSCEHNSFSKFNKRYISKDTLLATPRNGALPPIRFTSFYMPKYGAGKHFDPEKNYIGFIIMAIYNNRWYTNSNDPFR